MAEAAVGGVVAGGDGVGRVGFGAVVVGEFEEALARGPVCGGVVGVVEAEEVECEGEVGEVELVDQLEVEVFVVPFARGGGVFDPDPDGRLGFGRVKRGDGHGVVEKVFAGVGLVGLVRHLEGCREESPTLSLAPLITSSSSSRSYSQSCLVMLLLWW